MKDILPELNNKDYIENLGFTYDIHFCRKEEIGDLVDFINQYWKRNHIFVRSRELLDWQHFDTVNKRYNFVLARHRESGEIHSVLGFVPTSQFDSSIENVEIWPCIWKSRDDIAVKGLGVSLYYYMKSHLKIETIAILGISEIALSIYKHWNFSTGKIEQYYYPNMQHREVLAKCMHTAGPVEKIDDRWGIKELSVDEYQALETSRSIFSGMSRYKSKNYYVNRYYRHPVYQYVFYGIIKDQKIDSLFVARECGYGENKCLRIVDYIGDKESLVPIRYELKELMIRKDYEYIDFMVVGMKPEIMERAGFINRKKNPDTIIPNYFEPFLQENIDLDYAFKSVNPKAEILFYKADADQDRPNDI